jgi:hypothetical protein
MTLNCLRMYRRLSLQRSVLLGLSSNNVKFSTSPSQESDRSSSPSTPTKRVLVYEGRLSSAINGLKLLSLSSSLVTSFGAPLLFFVNDTTTFGVKFVAISGSCCFFKVTIVCIYQFVCRFRRQFKSTSRIGIAGFGLFTTSLLHWVSSPYIHKLFELPNGEFEAETRSLFGRVRVTRFNRQTVAPRNERSLRPFASFVVGKKVLYLHSDDVPQHVITKLGLPMANEQTQTDGGDQ